MSTAPSSSRSPRPRAEPDPAYRRPDMGRLHARRRDARRRRQLARLDVGIGVVGALFLIIISPGLAVTAIVALLILAGCGASVLIGRRRRAAAAGVREAPRAGPARPEVRAADRRQPARRPRSGTRP